MVEMGKFGKAELPLQMAVYVPSTKRMRVKVSKGVMGRRVKEVVRYLNKTFGGTTRIRGVGSYTPKKGSEIEENVVIVESFSSNPDWNKAHDMLYSKILHWKKRWSQESMGFEFENDFHFVS